jgi:predicted acylesterase/phospholipase RssA
MRESDLNLSNAPRHAKVPIDIILCLSGGGLRATFFHLGVIRALREAGLLDHRLTDVISVSGGSIAAAHLALNWSRYTGTDDEYSQAEVDLLSLRHWDLRGRAIRRSFLTSPCAYLADAFFTEMPERYRRRRIEHLRADYNRFFKEKHFSSLHGADPALSPPTLHIMATSFATGEPCTFSNQDYQSPLLDAKLSTATTPIATAVAASSAFPPIFGPILVTGHDFGNQHFQFSHSLHDGGVYDNTGVERVSQVEISNKRPADLVIVSDAGKPFEKDERRPYRRMFTLATRTIDILMNRIAKSAENNFSQRVGDRLLRVAIDDKAEGVIPDASQGDLPYVRTDLDSFSDAEAYSLVLHGRAIATQALQERFGDAIALRKCDDLYLRNGLPENKKLRKAIFEASRTRWWSFFNFRDWATLPFIALLLIPLITLASAAVVLKNYFDVYTSFSAELASAASRADASAKELAKASRAVSDERSNSARITGELEAARRELQTARVAPPPKCRTPANGIERYQRTFPVTRDSGWRGGGSSPHDWCNVVLTQVRAENPGARVEITAPQEDSKDSCQPFNCRQYKYTCTVVVEAEPIYREASSPECPAQR